MASNTRGRLKELFEAVHRNSEWQKKHLAEALVLIDKHNPKLTDGINTLAKAIDELDNLALGIYARL